ncbi:MAG: pyrroline-5-carboxylate reductase [Bacteroidaceae bacterium]|nr:pyrroline-5-carboxylate reductase [Bacteroidaceae bacterium]
MKVAIIGVGNMGGAVCEGLFNKGMDNQFQITAADASQEKLELLKTKYPKLDITTNNQQAAKGADLVIVAVKPWLVQPVVAELQMSQSQIYVSIAAGVDFAQLESYTGLNAQPMYRVIPNTAISDQQSMTLICKSHTTSEQDALITQLFGSLGRVLFIPESKMAAGTALASCGIAYVFKYIQASIQAGIELGLTAQEAREITLQTFIGATTILNEHGQHPAIEIEKVCTPGGITIKGINQLEHDGFTSAVIRAMKASM